MSRQFPPAVKLAFGLGKTAVQMPKLLGYPMDTADASLIALAETAGYTRIFSIDSDFYVYRLANETALEVVPGPMQKGR